MSDNRLAELLKTQKSLTEWLQDIGHQDTEALRREDNEKRERLKVLNRTINLPFDEPVQFEATDITNRTLKFKTYLKDHGQDLCALRLIPKDKALPKLRMRGKTVSEAVVWFHEQEIDSKDYRADFMPHPPDYSWATIFVVNRHGIQGEIIFGGHHQLTQGFHDSSPPLVFRYDFTDWHILPDNKDAIRHLKILAKHLKVADKTIQKALKEGLGASFSHDYLEGYFETTDSSLGTWFIDYSPSLGHLYNDFVVKTSISTQSNAIVSGQTGCNGQATGRVQIVDPTKLDEPFAEGSILVCPVTTPLYVPLMQKAAAIVTDQGGILSHAAIVARELKIPCIVATGNATKVLKNGQTVTVDATNGIVLPV
ncbi:MAG: PEP-utilizing enzyme [Candidatus Saccharimonadales bacterium]